MQDRILDTKSSVEDHFTDAENAIISETMSILDSDEAKELEIRQAKLALAESKVASLTNQLEKISQQLLDEKSRYMFVHKQSIDLYHKIKLMEDENKAAQSKIKLLQDLLEAAKRENKASLLSEPRPKLEVVVEKVLATTAPSEGLGRRLSHAQTDLKPSLFRRSTNMDLYSMDNKQETRRREACANLDSSPCVIL